MTDDASFDDDGEGLARAAALAAAAEESGHAHDEPVAGKRPPLRQFGLRALVILFILNAVDEFDRAILAIGLDDIRADFGISDATVGLLPLAVIFITGIVSLPAGNLADRTKRVNILAAGAMIWGAAGLIAATSGTFIQLFLTRALLGTGQGTIAPTHFSLLSDYYPVSVRGRVLGYHRAANPAGQVIGAVVGGAIVAAAGWRWGFAAAAVPGLIFGLYALTLREPKRGEADLAQAVVDNPMLAEFLREPEDKMGFFASLGTIFRNRTLRYLIFTNAALGFALFGIIFWIPTFFEREYGFSTNGASLALAGLALAGFIGTWYGGPLADDNVRKGFTHLVRVGVGGTAFLGVTWTIGFLVPFAPLTLAFLMGGAVVTSLVIPGVSATVAAVAPPRIRGQAFSAFGLALAVFGASAAPLVVGLLSELFQAQFGVDNGTSLRFAMLLSTTLVMALGTWLMYQASRTAAEDVQQTLSEFIASYTRRSD